MTKKSELNISPDIYMSAQQLAEQLGEATKLLEELSNLVLEGGFQRAKLAVKDQVDKGATLFESINYVYQKILSGKSLE
jgi:hypothetical protein